MSVTSALYLVQNAFSSVNALLAGARDRRLVAAVLQGVLDHHLKITIVFDDENDRRVLQSYPPRNQPGAPSSASISQQENGYRLHGATQ